jgi:molecular chaperone HtpG
MSGLVSLQVKQPQWSKPADQIFIGKDILELLSTSMYIDPLTMYREYIQNAADAHDADAATLDTNRIGSVRIKINRQERSILISDDGLGLSERDFHKRLTSIGGSTKRGTNARGFRGVGRLAGLAYCQELIFRTRPAGKDSVYELRWDSRKVRTLLRSSDTHLDLAGIIAESIESRTISATGYPEHFFEVELRNVVRHRDDRLLNALDVSQYLGQVAPVSFHPDFSFGHEITNYLRSNGVGYTPLSVEIEGEGPVFRPHRNEIAIGGKRLKLLAPEMFTTLDREGECSAVTWVLHHEYLGTLPKSTMINGWRLRSGDVQVGGNDILEELFPESRFNGWMVAETHVLSKKIIPNGRRDNYEHSAHFSDLLTRLTPTAKDIAHRCRVSSISRNALQKHEADLAKCEESIAIASKPRTPAFVVASLRQEVESCLSSLEKTSQRGLFSDSEGDRFQVRIKKITTKLKALPEDPDTADALQDFPPAQRSIIKDVIETIYLAEGQSEVADRLVGKILSKLRSTKRKQK